MAKVQDITSTDTYKNVVLKEKAKPNRVDDLIQLGKIGKELINNNISKNLNNLNNKGIFDKALMTTRLKTLNSNKKELDKINSEYNGSVFNYVNATNKKRLDQTILSYYNLEPGSAFKVGNPDVVYGDYLKQLNKEGVEKINNLRKDMENVGLADLDNVKTYVDDTHANAFTDLQSNFKVRGADIISSLFGGDPYSNANSKDLKEYVNKQAYTKKFSEVEDINNTFRALFSEDPALATNFEDIVKKADIRQGIKTTTSGISDELSDFGPKGRQTKAKVQYITHSWTDKLGKNQTSREKIIVQAGRIVPLSIENQSLYGALIKEGQGQKVFNEAIEDGFSYKAAYEEVPSAFKKTSGTIRNENILEKNRETLIKAYEDYKENTYYETSKDSVTLQETSKLKPDLEAFLADTEGEVKKPAYYLPTFNSFIKNQYPTLAPTIDINPENIKAESKSYVLDENLTTTSGIYTEFIDNPNEVGKVRDFIFNNELNKLEQLQDDYKNGITTELVSGTSIYIDKNKKPLTMKQLQDLGLDEVLPTPKENEIGYRLGYNINTDKLELLASSPIEDTSGSSILTREEIDEADKSGVNLDNNETRTMLQKINDIPVVGSVTETLVGDTLEVGDKFVLGAVGLSTGVITVKQGSKLTAPAIGNYLFNTKAVQTFSKEIISKRKKGKLFGFTSQAGYTKYVNSLPAWKQSLISSMSASGKSFDRLKFAKGILPKLGAVKVLKNVGKKGGKFLFGTKIAAATSLLSLGTVAYNALLDQPEEETNTDK